MVEGLLWFDTTKQMNLPDIIGDAATRYCQKYGHRPTICYLNSADLNGDLEINGIKLRGAHNILRYHLWIGIENDNDNIDNHNHRTNGTI